MALVVLIAFLVAGAYGFSIFKKENAAGISLPKSGKLKKLQIAEAMTAIALAATLLGMKPGIEILVVSLIEFGIMVGILLLQKKEKMKIAKETLVGTDPKIEKDYRMKQKFSFLQVASAWAFFILVVLS